jgi:alkanesulfonate monooxygenase SsuD/methylene tetrahydromethanopterin reductase-like flavin-dependent oxidoreductase (luciferase family)
VFIMRFDMRCTDPAQRPSLYATAIEMSAWAETRGCLAIVLCEHHAADDGYLPVPLILASAIAARTQQVAINVAATLLPLYDPVRLAEEMSVLDHISQGRVSYVLALGYRPEEYEHFGIDMRARGRIADANLDLLRRLLRGEPVIHEGRRIHVTPEPCTPGGPALMWGGGTVAAARRAGRYGLPLLAQGSVPGMQEAYERASREHGHEPGMTILPDRDTPMVTFVADDIDRAWEQLGPYLLHDALAYAAWNPGNVTTVGITDASTVEELRAVQRTHRIIGVERAVEEIRAGGMLNLAPLCGGVPSELAWQHLELVAEVVLPHTTSG